MALKPGITFLNKYEILAEIGRGSFGRVYKAREVDTGHTVAIKELRDDLLPEMADEAEYRFRNERKIGRSFDHPHIVKTYTIEQYQSKNYLVLEYMSGGSLRQKLDKEGPLPIAEAVRITRQICSALSEIHRRDLVHRDITPHNIMFAENGSAKLMDFGLVQEPGGSSGRSWGMGGTQPGAPAYKSPEAETQQEYLKSRSDVFMLGAVLFEMLTGRIYKSRSEGTPPSQLRPDIPNKLDAVVLKAVAENEHERYQTATEFSNALANAMTQPTKPIWLIIPAIIIGLILLLGVGGWGFAKLRQLTPTATQTTAMVAAPPTHTVIHAPANTSIPPTVTPQPATKTPLPTTTQTPTTSATSTSPPTASVTPQPTTTNTPTNVPKPIFVIENFENYNSQLLQDTYHINAAWGVNEGNIGLNGPPDVSDGTQALTFNYDIRNSAPDDYSGFERDFSSQNWSQYSSFCFWVRSDNTNRNLVIQFKENSGEAWKYVMLLSDTTGNNCIPFYKFKFADWSQANNNQVDLGAINYYSFFVEGQQGAGAVHLDNIYLQ